MAVESAAARLARILVLVPWVHAQQQNGGLGARIDDLCARFGVDRATLLVDLDAVQCSGIPPFSPDEMIEVWIDADRVTLRMAEHLARPPRLSRAEAWDLLLRARAVSALPDLGEAPALRSAIDKLAAVIGDGATEATGGVAVDLQVPGSEHVLAMREAIGERRRLRIEYYSHGRGEMTEREIDPLLVAYANGSWYVIARDVAADEERTFRLDRLRAFAPTGASFEPPEGFDADAHHGGLILTPATTDVQVSIDLQPQATWIIEEVPYERMEKRPDGSTRLHLRTAHLAWLVRLLLVAGSGARAVRPKELVETVEVAARAALASYDEG